MLLREQTPFVYPCILNRLVIADRIRDGKSNLAIHVRSYYHPSVNRCGRESNQIPPDTRPGLVLPKYALTLRAAARTQPMRLPRPLHCVRESAG